jgi:hypothetical protein
MTTVFEAISDDFLSDLEAISELVSLVERGGGSSKSRIASINSAILLLAATFEEFVREMGRQYAREFVSRVTDTRNLPRKLTATAWKRTLEELARAKIDTGGTPAPLLHIATGARSSFESICKFLEGDTSQDIYKSLIHNENNMRPEQINAIFKVCDLSNFCAKISELDYLKEYFDEEDENKVHGKLTVFINDFMEKRNNISHALNPRNSVSVDLFLKDIGFLKAVALSMARCLSEYSPSPI